MNPLEALLNHHPLPTWRPLAWPAMIMLTLTLTWANFAKLEEVAVAPGTIIPKGQIKVIQHLEGGIIMAIFAREGSRVKKGDKLIHLNLATSGVNKEELQVRLDSQKLVRARLKAEITGRPIIFPDSVAKSLPAQVKAQKSTYLARKRELATNLAVLENLVRQRSLEVDELKAKIKAAKNSLRLAAKRLEMSKTLLAEKLTPKMEHLQLEAEVETLQGALRSLIPTVPRARAAIEEARGRVEEEKNRFRREAQEESIKTEQAISRITEFLNEATEQGARSEIRSPIDGIVKKLQHNTIGGVVRPGEPIMEIVPSDVELVVEAKLKLLDRGYVKEGQSVMVKLSTYDYARYGGLDGIVDFVAPDSSTDENGEPFFRILVSVEKNYLGEREGVLPIMAGMEATVDIHTGEKSVMDYLVKPVLKLQHESFRER